MRIIQHGTVPARQQYSWQVEDVCSNVRRPLLSPIAVIPFAQYNRMWCNSITDTHQSFLEKSAGARQDFGKILTCKKDAFSECSKIYHTPREGQYPVVCFWPVDRMDLSTRLALRDLPCMMFAKLSAFYSPFPLSTFKFKQSPLTIFSSGQLNPLPSSSVQTSFTDGPSGRRDTHASNA